MSLFGSFQSPRHIRRDRKRLISARKMNLHVETLETRTLLAGHTSFAEPGDIDDDGTVTFADFLILSANFGQTVDPGTNGDIDGDGTVAFPDFLVLSANFGQSVAAVDAALAEL